ncbi:MAG: zinc-binding alcohol dehydrogenase family protein [Chloroflexi bacterium]|nr:zinc-binding alcohol dehydrogenase family protein [Chloroflexota bacterium]
MKYKSVVAVQRGGPEMLQVVENDLRSPKPGEVRIKVLAASVTLPEVEARYGARRSRPESPSRRAMPSSA